MATKSAKTAATPAPVATMNCEAIDRALVKAMPILAKQPRDTVLWTWLRGAYEAGAKDKAA